MIIQLAIFLCSFLTLIPLQGSSYSPQEPLRIMTFNIRYKKKEIDSQNNWKYRLPKIITMVHNVKPNILGLQEPVKKQMKDLVKQLPSQYAWFGASRGSSWFRLDSDEFNPIFYNKERLELLKHGTFNINSNTWWFVNPASTGWLKRICTWGLFKDINTNTHFYIYNTHLDHKFTTARLNGLRTIKKYIKKQNKEKLPLILMGDFNTELSHTYKKVLHSFINTKDYAQEITGPSNTYTGYGLDKQKNIDHILFAHHHKQLVVHNHTTIEEVNGYLSDHRPVYITAHIN